ncbi:MAG TPA: tRNA pseudouridine(38-40) synthase TruA [Thermoanaerobaculia bacterium]|nr:tRNA pseudouridine(38-40) synthase TruA [Thermoanaerobaculia bacterium]
MRLLMTIQYLGTRYAGWQTQANAVGVQQVVEEALTRLFGSRIRIEGAGRTDAGVHAAGQRAHADVPFEIPSRGLVLGTNDLLPPDIRLLAVERVAGDFHCRFAAKRKTYRYCIWNAAVADVFHAATHAHVARPLDAGAMRAAAEALVGTHDFRSFTVTEPEVSSTERTIESVGIAHDGPRLVIDVTANGFLRHMVRRIAGSLIEVGRGKLGCDAVRRALEPSFEEARWTAPAKGLTLWSVEY